MFDMIKKGETYPLRRYAIPTCRFQRNYVISPAQHESLGLNTTIPNPQRYDGDGENESPPLWVEGCGPTSVSIRPREQEMEHDCEGM